MKSIEQRFDETAVSLGQVGSCLLHQYVLSMFGTSDCVVIGCGVIETACAISHLQLCFMHALVVIDL